MATKITPFLMFEGKAEEAMNFYVSLFENSCVTRIKRYGPGEAGPEGTIMQAAFSIAGQAILCIDSPMKHGFTFTPSFSLFVDCGSEEELDMRFNKLSESGQIMMPPANYGFSRKFAWVSDRYGVSWQLNLTSE
jgi:predicted 3-demethylubiquinone-9 3-methyltransferase (glyoxalase superfamily)